MITSLVIPIAKLKMSKPAEFDKAKVEQLSVSIREDGLLHIPVVRVLKDNADFTHEVIAGRKRIYACGKFLGLTEIECSVVDADDDRADSMEQAENVFRTSLSDESARKALVKWHAVYTKLHPNASGKGAKQKQDKVAAAVEAAAEAAAPVVAVEGQTKPAKKTKAEKAAEAPKVATPKPFAKVLEETLGISSSSAGRLARVARNLTEEQITVLSQQKVTADQIDQIAALGKGEPIDHAIKLIGSGLNADEAVRQAAKLKPEKPAKAAKPAKAGDKPSAAPKSKELTDEEWLSTYCGTILCNLKHKVAFKNDAILYRRMAEGITRFRTSVKKAVEEAKDKSGHNGAFFHTCFRMIRAAHPQHWLVCSFCTGKALDPAKPSEPCPKCFGAGYKMKLED